jgi:hypothetical protein
VQGAREPAQRLLVVATATQLAFVDAPRPDVITAVTQTATRKMP